MTNEQIDDITEVVYRIRLEQDCQTNVKRMIEKDKDGGAKLRGRSRSYRRTVEAVLEAAGVIPPGSQLKYLIKEGLQGPLKS